ncbi:universal stress protein [Halolamina sp.]|jgi:nucleotide-binding universal stress UspA family protein|uniref:universal stress protein n=1 Tax=Halolamina sp. TaxID=1940283 RepID=UPI000223B49D|nr:UspA domain-containing protein [halophilic archaeon DL31]
MYEDILLPIDGSEPSLRAADHAIELATTYDATLHALYVVDSDPSPLAVSRADVRETLREVGEEAGEAAFAELEPLAEAAGIELILAMLEGNPEQCIVDYATDHEVDLVVMGTHGRAGLGRRLVGSVTERVVRSAPVPVVTVGNENED